MTPINLLANYQPGNFPEVVASLSADINGDGKDECIVCFNYGVNPDPFVKNGNILGMGVYELTDGTMVSIWQSENIGQGCGNIQFLTGDVNGDGKDEIIQLWDSNNYLSMLVYAADANCVITMQQSPTFLNGPEAMDYFIGDINGDGKAEIVQVWNNEGYTGFFVYGVNSNGNMVQLSSWSSSVGAGGTYLMCDVNGDGKKEIVQFNGDSQSFSAYVYGTLSTFNFSLYSSASLDNGMGAVGWVAGDVNGDGKDEIVQMWDQSGQISFFVYGINSASQIIQLSTSTNLNGPGNLGFLVLDVNGDGKKEIIQFWDDSNELAMMVYGATVPDNIINDIWSTPYSGEGCGFDGIVKGIFNKNGSEQFIQVWNGGLLAYGTS